MHSAKVVKCFSLRYQKNWISRIDRERFVRLLRMLTLSTQVCSLFSVVSTLHRNLQEDFYVC